MSGPGVEAWKSVTYKFFPLPSPSPFPRTLWDKSFGGGTVGLHAHSGEGGGILPPVSRHELADSGQCLLLGGLSVGGQCHWQMEEAVAVHHTCSSRQSYSETAEGEGQQRDFAFSYNHHSGCNLETQMDRVVTNQRLDPNLWKLEFEGPTLKSGRAQKK